MGIEGISNNTNTMAASGMTAEVALFFSAAAVEKIQRSVIEGLSILETLQEIFTGTEGNQAIDDLDAPMDGQTDEVRTKNLEKIIALLQMDTDDAQIKEARERIENNREAIKNKHAANAEKIKESIETAEKAEKNSKVAKAFAWIGAALAIAAAFAACVISGGIAVGPCLAAALAVTSLVISEVDGAQEKVADFFGEFCNFCSKLFTGKEMDGDEKRFAGSIFFSCVMLAASVATMFIPSSAVIHIADASAKAVQMANYVTLGSKIMNGILAVGNTSTSIAGGVLNKYAADDQADAKEIQRFLAQLQLMQDEDSEMLQELVEKLQTSLQHVAQMMAADVQSYKDIIQNIGSSQAAMI